jgi:hypothetical protein
VAVAAVAKEVISPTKAYQREQKMEKTKNLNIREEL